MFVVQSQELLLVPTFYLPLVWQKQNIKIHYVIQNKLWNCLFSRCTFFYYLKLSYILEGKQLEHCKDK